MKFSILFAILFSLSSCGTLIGHSEDGLYQVLRHQENNH